MAMESVGRHRLEEHTLALSAVQFNRAARDPMQLQFSLISKYNSFGSFNICLEQINVCQVVGTNEILHGVAFDGAIALANLRRPVLIAAMQGETSAVRPEGAKDDVTAIVIRAKIPVRHLEVVWVGFEGDDARIRIIPQEIERSQTDVSAGINDHMRIVDGQMAILLVKEHLAEYR